jgi:hypothetical protein
MQDKEKRQIVANSKFVEVAEAKFEEWARIKGLDFTFENVMLFMLKHSLLREKIINRYLVANLYKELRHDGIKGEQCIHAVCDVVPYERTNVYDILKNYSNHFNENKLRVK